nr:MAG TPA: hypothetical protein [Caudoviricetes sp.]
MPAKIDNTFFIMCVFKINILIFVSKSMSYER